MFGISKKVDYGMELMIALAKNWQKKPVSLREVAKAKNLPFKFLEQVAMPLRQAGLIESKAGRTGGYLLKKVPGKISVAEVVEVLAGPVQVGHCLGCPQAAICGQKDVWAEVGEKVQKTIEGKTLKDLIR